MDTKSALILWHKNCFDGYSSAWIVATGLQAINESFELMPAVYGEEPPDVTDRNVYIVDFSYPPDVLERMIQQADFLTLIDHHKKAEELLAPIQARYLQEPAVTIVFDQSRSGVGLTWNFFHAADDPIPELFELIEDYDLHRFAHGEDRARWINAALTNYPFDLQVWTTLIEQPIGILEREGQILLKKAEREVTIAIEDTQREMIIGGYRVPVVNAPIAIRNAVCARLYADPTVPFAACYQDLKEGRKFSLRAAKASPIDVDLIARQYNDGGGHKSAAGFLMEHGWEGDPIEHHIIIQGEQPPRWWDMRVTITPFEPS